MNVKKLLWRTIIILVALTIAVLIAVLRPWQYIDTSSIISSGTALTVNTPQGKAEVYFDGDKVGETPFSSENLPSGEHALEIRRIAESTEFYENVSKQIHLEPNTRTFVEAEIGPSKQFSTITIMHYRKNTDSTSSLYIDTLPEEATVWIDDEKFENPPITSETLSAGKHTVKVTAEGYTEGEASIIIREGYTLVVEMQLMAKPIEIPSL